MTKKQQKVVEKYVKALKENLENYSDDREVIQINVDELLIQALIDLGLNELVNAYNKCSEVGFWYA